MTGPLDSQDDANTPLTEEEKEGLIPSYITLRSELNEAEQANILDAEDWARKRRPEGPSSERDQNISQPHPEVRAKASLEGCAAYSFLPKKVKKIRSCFLEHSGWGWGHPMSVSSSRRSHPPSAQL